MDALTYIATKWSLTLSQRSPVEIPNTNRVSLARLFFLLEFRCGVEVGVESGEYSEVLCQQNPGVHLYCVDAWRAYPGYRDHVNQGRLETFYQAAQQRLSPYKATLIRKFSVEAAQDFKDGSLDFIYLDGNHSFPQLTADLAAWSPKVRAGGIIAGHDFRRHKWPNQMHVEQVIYGWTDAYDIHPWFVLGRKAKVDGELRDDGRSWFWVHEPRPAWRRTGGRPMQQ